jgi:hypothetical protein
VFQNLLRNNEREDARKALLRAKAERKEFLERISQIRKELEAKELNS